MNFLSRKGFQIVLGFLSVVGYGFFVFAAAPTGGYNPAQTNDPNCAPNDTDCFVKTLSIITENTYNWMGQGSGGNGGSTDNTVFIGIGAGDNADNAAYSNFVGTGAGQNATNANNSNFFGQLAGCNATNADNANFFGQEAGCYATNANNSNFFGYRSGYQATNADHSTFFGDLSGFQASSAYSSSFIGANAGNLATNAYQANFFGRDAGNGATNASDSTFMGYQSGMDAVNASGSIFAGNNSGFEATDAFGSNFFGNDAGYQAYGAQMSNFLGYQAGYNDDSLNLDFLTTNSNPYHIAGGSNFLGYQAGYGAAGAVQSTFVGTMAGYKAGTGIGSTIVGFLAGSNAVNSTYAMPTLAASVIIGASAAIDTIASNNMIMIGSGAGHETERIDGAVFIGENAVGSGAKDVKGGIFLGASAGTSIQYSTNTIFMGDESGNQTLNTNNAIFIGTHVASGENVNNQLTKITYSGLVGTFSPGERVTGSISNYGVDIINDSGTDFYISDLTSYFTLGETITGYDSGATATVASVTRGTTSILIGNDSHTGGYQNSIALGSESINSTNNQFMIGSINSPIDEIRVVQTGGTQCIIDASGLGCSSDERLKTNISDLSANILDTLTKVRTVTYNWKTNPGNERMIGFLAQDLEQYYPELVKTNEKGFKSVNYANMAPVLTEAVRELNIKITNLEAIAQTVNPTLLESLKTWFADKTNGINKLFVHEVCLTDGSDEECITLQQLRQLKAGQPIQVVVPSSPEVIPTDSGSSSTITDSGTDSGSTTVEAPTVPDPVPPVVDPVPDPTPIPDPVPVVTDTPVQ